MPTIVNQTQGEEHSSVPGSGTAFPEASVLLLSISKADYSFKDVKIISGKRSLLQESMIGKGKKEKKRYIA